MSRTALMSRVGPLAFLFLLVSAPAAAQPISGTVTVNSDGGGDYMDLGAAFDALTAEGIGGPTVVEVVEGATPYISAANYLLINVAGVSATNTITVRPAAGDRPVISGSAVQVLGGPMGTLGIGTSHTTVEGLEITGGANFGLLLFRDADDVENITVSGNYIHGVTDGNGIWSSFDIANLTIINNLLADCRVGTVPISGDVSGAIAILSPGANTVIEHNTIVVDDASASSSLIGEGGAAGVAIGRLNYNVFVYGHSDVVPYTFMRDPTAADYNLFFATGTATAIDLAAFTTATGLDANSVEGDPLFTASLGIAGDFGLGATSPAVNAAVGSTSTRDAEGTTRPQGSAPDIGAFEFPEVVVVDPPEGDPNLTIRRPEAVNAISTEDVIDVGILALSPQSLPFEIFNGGPGAGVISNIEIVSSMNVASVSVSPGMFTVAPELTDVFTVQFTPSMGGTQGFDFEIELRITSNDPMVPVFEFTLVGLGRDPVGPSEPVDGRALRVTGNPEFDTSVCHPWTVASAGSQAVTITDIRSSETDAEMRFVVMGFTGPATLEPGEETAFEVCSASSNSSFGRNSANVIFESDADMPVEVPVRFMSREGCSVSRVGNGLPVGPWAIVAGLAGALFVRRRRA